jgi:hypothetical protein
MDTHPDLPDNLIEMERQLAARVPSAVGLSADAMLFAAGRASARSGTIRFLWPTLAACASVLAVIFGVALFVERSECLTLANQLQQAKREPISNPSPSVSLVPPVTADESPDSYLASRHALEKGLDAWPPLAVGRVVPSNPRTPETSTFQVRSLNELLAQ